LAVASRKAVETLLRRKPEYGVILECVDDGAILSEVILCAIEKGMSRSPNTIASKIYVLARYGVLKLERFGKYTIVTKTVRELGKKI